MLRFGKSDSRCSRGTLIVDGDIYFDSAININDYGTVILNAGKYVDLTIKGDRTLYDMLGEGKAFFDANGNLFNASVQAGSDLTIKDHSHTYVDGKWIYLHSQRC